MSFAYLISNILLLAAETQSPGRGGNTDEGSGPAIVIVIAVVVIAALAVGLWMSQRSKV